MTHRQVATLACRVLAIWALISALGLLSDMIQSLGTLHRMYTMNGRSIDVQSFLWQMGGVAPVFVQLVAGIWLWKRAPVVAVWMTGQDLQDEPDEREATRRLATMEQVQAVVLSSLGVWAVLGVLPRVGSAMFQFVLAWIIARGRFDAGAHVVTSQIFIWSIQLLLGLWLIFGALGITKMLQRARGDKPAAGE